MIKKIIISACLLLSLMTFAQDGTASPYSFYGIGDVRYKGVQESRSMTGLAVEQDSIHINLDNPASYSNLKLTTFTVGGTYCTVNQKTNSLSESAKRSTFDYLAVGLPLGKFGLGFGMIPYSSVGYKIKSVSADNSKNSYRYNGSGGLNKVFLGLGYKINPKFSIGADVNYNFGKIETNSLTYIYNLPIGTQETNTAVLSGVNFNVGMMYQTKINKKLNFYNSLNYTLESTLTSKNTQNRAAVSINSNFNLSSLDSANDVNSQIDLTLPSKITFGSGIGESKKWLLGAQISLGEKGSLSNSYNTFSNVSYESYQKYCIGGYFIPKYNSFTSYAKRITYRGGLKFEKTGLVIDTHSINDLGFTLGIGMPISGSFSNLNFGFEMGKRGTTTAGLIQENYANFSVGLSLNDKWFEKRKFN